MTSVESTLSLRLKKAGFSLTQPRLLVFKVLQNNGPLSMQELYSRLQARVNRTTVYRVFELFETLKIAQRVAKGWKYQLELTDEFIPHHHHFTCTQCQIMISFDEPESFNEILQTVAMGNGFNPTSHTLEIEGLCRNCRL
jgi:Fe2+ or Zn2+ uptake regulation protein